MEFSSKWEREQYERAERRRTEQQQRAAAEHARNVERMRVAANMVTIRPQATS